MGSHSDSDTDASVEITKAVAGVAPRILDSLDRIADKALSFGPWIVNTQFSHQLDNSFGLLNDRIVDLRKKNIKATLDEAKAILAERNIEDFYELSRQLSP